MDLHTSKEPDWAGLDPGEMTNLQWIAARSNGWVTPGNVISVAGAALTTKGLLEVKRGNYDNTALYLAAGRMLDVADGIVAHKTRTKSPTGEVVDAGLDKVLIFGAFALLWSEEVIPRPILASFAAQNSANVVFSGIAKQRGREIHPTKIGKFTTFGQWATIGMGIVEKSIEQTPYKRAAKLAGLAMQGLAVVSTMLGADATKGYVKDAVGSN